MEPFDSWDWEPRSHEDVEEARQVYLEYMDWLAGHEEREYRHWLSQGGAG